jgi:hypothetical protein
MMYAFFPTGVFFPPLFSNFSYALRKLSFRVPKFSESKTRIQLSDTNWNWNRKFFIAACMKTRFRVKAIRIPTRANEKLVEAYCVKCKSKREMKDPKTVTLKNGKPATQGVCPVCGTKMFRIGGGSKS